MCLKARRLWYRENPNKVFDPGNCLPVSVSAAICFLSFILCCKFSGSRMAFFNAHFLLATSIWHGKEERRPALSRSISAAPSRNVPRNICNSATCPKTGVLPFVLLGHGVAVQGLCKNRCRALFSPFEGSGQGAKGSCSSNT